MNVRVKFVYMTAVAALLSLVTLVTWLQHSLDRRLDQQVMRIEELAQLPRGEYLKPALLGYHHLGADILWMKTLQVLGKKHNSADDYVFIYHALDVITTLDPQYAYPYYVGGVVLTNLGNRVDLSNQLLEKGHGENPNEWNLPFLLGYNHYFHLGDAAKGAEYIGRAARTTGAPSFLPGLATRMYAEAGDPDVALQFLEALWKDNPDLAVREKLAIRANEIIIERDLRTLEVAVVQFRQKHAKLPARLSDLVSSGYLTAIPEEPFGGIYQLDSATGEVSSSSRSTRLKVYRKDKEMSF
jgi:tetratricopeptide (TPR) repeat protein